MKQTMITLTFKNQEKFVISGHPDQGKDFRLPKFKHNPKRKNEKQRPNQKLLWPTCRITEKILVWTVRS